MNPFSLISFIFLILLIGFYQTKSYVTLPLVNTNQGLVRGLREKSLNGREFYSFRGIPYTEPPTGVHRFKDPVPANSWKEILDGTKDMDPCLQFAMYDYSKEDHGNLQFYGQEDCLVLNIFTPEINTHTRFPVMVFIHGGGFIGGGAKAYTPYIFLDEEVILVVIQYRLGVFGFLSTEDSIMPGNMGLKDQQLALKWINENIAEFGGDSQLVTIFGESAGGASVHYHMLSPDSKGLFQRAIMQSGTSLCPWSNSKNHREFAQDAGRHFNCSIETGSEKYLRCMQGVDGHELLRLSSETVKWGISPLYVLPRVDGKFLPEAQETLMKQGKYNKVEVMAGINKDEGVFALMMFPGNPSMIKKLNINFEEYGTCSLYFNGESNAVQKTLDAYRHYLERENVKVTKDDYEQLIKLYSDRYFGVCHDSVANSLAADEDITLYLYQLDHVGQGSLANHFMPLIRKNWTAHADDIFYMFNGAPFFSEPLTKKGDLKVREAIIKTWTNFAKYGNPNAPELNFTWDAATPGRFRHLSLVPNPTMVDDNYAEVRQFWSTLLNK